MKLKSVDYHHINKNLPSRCRPVEKWPNTSSRACPRSERWETMRDRVGSNHCGWCWLSSWIRFIQWLGWYRWFYLVSFYSSFTVVFVFLFLKGVVVSRICTVCHRHPVCIWCFRATLSVFFFRKVSWSVVFLSPCIGFIFSPVPCTTQCLSYIPPLSWWDGKYA